MYLVEEPTTARFKSKLKKRRVIKGYTQEELATLSGVNIKSIAAYEQNESKIASASVSTVAKLADSLGCEIEDIINKKEIVDNDEVSE
jgi:transcriptional regulator with XRE-family HTH domain